MAAIEKKTKRYPSDLTDKEWSSIEPLLPKPAKRGRKRTTDPAGGGERDPLHGAGGLRVALFSRGAG
jgi:transposase